MLDVMSIYLKNVTIAPGLPHFNRRGMMPMTSGVSGTEMEVRIHGVSFQMNTFRCPYGTMLGEVLLKHSDNLN